MEQPFPISVMLTVSDMKKSLAFYRDTLGFELKECWPDEKNAMWASLRLDGQAVMLGAQMDPDKTAQMCADDPGAVQYAKTLAKELAENRRGVGIITYVAVKDVDAFHAAITKRGCKNASAPKSQFYGLRETALQDPDGYRYNFYMAIKMASCQSCGMPMKDAKPGEMYCGYCTDSKGQLKPYEQVFEGTTVGYFMQHQKMSRPEAEKATKAHLATMPAWKSRGK